MGVSLDLRAFLFFVFFLTWQAGETPAIKTHWRRETCRKCTICPNILFIAASELTDRYQSDTLARDRRNNRLFRLKHQRVNRLHLRVQISVNSDNNFQNYTFSSFSPPKNLTSKCNKCSFAVTLLLTSAVYKRQQPAAFKNKDAV